MKIVLAMACLFGAMAAQSTAAVITFEGFAPAGNLINVNPASPYSEAGFTLTPVNGSSAVFDAAAAATFPGDSTSWFGFASGNTITLTGAAPFSLDSLILGPSSVGSGNVDFTVTGNIFGGGTVSVTFSGLTSATLEAINFTNLQSVTFDATTDSGLDNITLNGAAAPEPASMLLFGAGLVAIGAIRRWRPAKFRA